ncbi:MAG: DASH family cryptochrome [Flavobacteriaceae bacterium]|nr:DASH family cryptochrome [Flavobacteriaceae bacterium]
MQNGKTSRALVWFRNDLRIHDQQSLFNACSNHDSVVAIYCIDPRHFEFDPYGFQRTAVFRAKFLMESITNLKTELHNLNISLFVYQDKPENRIPEFCGAYDIDHIYFQKEWTPYEKAVEDEVRNQMESQVKFSSYYDQFLYHPEDIPMEISKIPQVFTVFRKQVEKYATIRTEIQIEKQDLNNRLENLTQVPKYTELGFHEIKTNKNSAFPFPGGENSGLDRLQEYTFKTGKLAYYKKTRNGMIGVDYSSKLSPWLANGSLSPRTIYRTVKQFEKTFTKNQSTYWLIFELIWRDFFKYISLRHGNDIFLLDGIRKQKYNWKTEYHSVRRWINGETDSDFVNANMIELRETGWMSNRGRQNVASYLTKDLQQDWRIGAAYFESLLLDFDVHSNYGNWMYAAGVGNDPRNRKFNVELQAQRYDPEHKFRKRWLQTSLFQ